MEGVAPVAKASGVGLFNWGFVQGLTQTMLPWDSWQKPYVDAEGKTMEPATGFFHELLRQNGEPFNHNEASGPLHGSDRFMWMRISMRI